MSDTEKDIRLDPVDFHVEDEDVFEEEEENPLDKLSEHERDYLKGIGAILGSTMDELHMRRFRLMPQMEREILIRYETFNMMSVESQEKVAGLLRDNWSIAHTLQYQQTVVMFFAKEKWNPVEEKKPEQGETSPAAKD